jgi:hypothetical protein
MDSSSLVWRCGGRIPRDERHEYIFSGNAPAGRWKVFHKSWCFGNGWAYFGLAG